LRQGQKDDLLFKLDDKELQQQRASNLTEIESRNSSCKSRARFETRRGLLAERLISQELFDNTKTTYELAKVSLERSQRDLAIVEERLTKPR